MVYKTNNMQTEKHRKNKKKMDKLHISQSVNKKGDQPIHKYRDQYSIQEHQHHIPATDR